MAQIIGEVLPLALGVAISPIPIIAAILMLLSPRAKSTSISFFLGWVLGVIIALLVFSLLGSLLDADEEGGPRPIAGTIRIVLGLLLLMLAGAQWRKRPEPGRDAPLPKWMSAINSMKPAGSLRLGFALAAVNPKNLMMAAAAGVAIGGSGLIAVEQLIVGFVFVVLAVSTVTVPVLAYLIARDRMRGPLDRLRGWLVANNATVMSTLGLVLGIVNVGKGIGSF